MNGEMNDKVRLYDNYINNWFSIAYDLIEIICMYMM